MEEIQIQQMEALDQLQYEETLKPDPKTIKLDMKEMINVNSNICDMVGRDNKTKRISNSIENLNLTTKYNIDINDINFDKDLENTPLQKSFMKLVKESVSHNNNNKEQETFNLFTTAFSLLNILGIDKESNRKARFPNTIE